MKKYFWLLWITLLLIIGITSNVLDGLDFLSYKIYGGIITLFGVYLIWIIMAIVLLKSEPKVKKTVMSDRYIDISKKEMQFYGINIYDFKKMAFNKFVDVHIAFSSFNFDSLKLNLTKDLYDYYIDELNAMENKGIINVIKDIELVSVKVYKIVSVHQMLQVSVYLNVRMLDYMYDTKCDRCISGNQSDKTSYEFELIFENRGDGQGLSGQFLLSQKKCINEMSIKNVDNMHKTN